MIGQITSTISKSSVASLLFRLENLWTEQKNNIKIDLWSSMRVVDVLNI